MKRIPALMLFLALGFARTACAWNSFGHIMIAAAAYEQLTPAA
jgi:hypothetical protein